MKKYLGYFLWFVIIITLVLLGIYAIYDSIENIERLNVKIEEKNIKVDSEVPSVSVVISNENENIEKEIDDWRLVLVNFENKLLDDFKVELSNIDKTRQFDSRAIDYLNQMMQALKDDGIKSVWVQSAYRSPEYQSELYNEKIEEVMNQNVSKEDAEEYTSKLINKPGTSEHNLGLAIDFNYVDEDFDKTEGFKWLIENAENYGFILRYKENKQDITKVSYEPWHWRFVGIEHAKKMNELNMCLEEYIEYLKIN